MLNLTKTVFVVREEDIEVVENQFDGETITLEL